MRCARCRKPLYEDADGWYSQALVTDDEVPGLVLADRRYECGGSPHQLEAPPGRGELIAAATRLHDESGCPCDPKYLMSCPRMASAVLEAGRAIRMAREGELCVVPLFLALSGERR